MTIKTEGADNRPKTWATSDQHFGHGRIIESCRRPFASVEAMNEELIRRHNSVVAPDDVVWHLGDFSFLRPPASAALLARLHGRHQLVLGNHDRTATAMLAIGFQTVQKSATFRVGAREFLASHKPTDLPPWKEWKPDQAGICGHVHDRWVRFFGVLNVGVDVHNFTPICLDEV